MDSTTPRRTIVALTAVALLALPTTGAASGGEKDYTQNGATGDYALVATVAEPGGMDWSDAAIGAGVGATLASSALGLTAVVRRRRVVSPAGAGSSGVAQ